jgi:replication factor-a protein 1 (Rpa1)
MALTPNSITRIFQGAKSVNFNPVIQVIDHTKLKVGTQLIISDGTFFTQALFSNQNFTKENLTNLKFEIIKLTEYQLGNTEENLFLMIIGYEKMYNPNQMIGNPSKIEFRNENPPQIKNIQYKLREPLDRKDFSEKKNPADRNDLNSTAKKIRIENDELYAPIGALSITSSDWTIKVRVTSKTQMKVWKNAKSEGKLFNCILLDSNSDEIQCSFFNSIADKFYDIIQVGNIYTISGGNVKNSNRRFSTIDNDIEINIEMNTLINQVADDGSILKVKYNFVPLDHLPKIGINQFVDVCGIVLEIDQISRITSKKGEELIKRILVITDHTECSIEVTLWGNTAQLAELDSLDLETKPVVAFKCLKTKDFNKLSLSSDRNGTTIDFNLQDHPNVKFLNDWKRRATKIYPSTPLSERKRKDIKLKTALEIKSEWQNPLILEKTEEFRIIGFLGKITLEDGNKQIWYEGCASSTCKKKVTRNSERIYNCETCGKNFEQCVYRYSTSLSINDCSGFIYITAFDEAMNEILGVTANYLYEMFCISPESAENLVSSSFGLTVNAIVKAVAADNREGYKLNIKRLEPAEPNDLTKIFMSEITTLLRR